MLCWVGVPWRLPLGLSFVPIAAVGRFFPLFYPLTRKRAGEERQPTPKEHTNPSVPPLTKQK